MLEKDIEARLGKMVKAHGCLYYKFVSPSNSGVPDRIIITPDGRIIFVELKTESGRPRRNQEWQIDEMRKRGADVRVVKGMSAAKELVTELFPSQEAGTA